MAGFSKMMGFGSDGGYWVITPDGKLERIPPWDPELRRQVTVALEKYPEALKTLTQMDLIQL